MKRSQLSQKLAAIATTGAMLSMSGSAFAQGSNVTLKNMTNNIATASSGLNNLISLVGYLGGSALAVSGILKLKAHMENPGQTKLSESISRLGGGGCLLSLPFITSAMQGSISNGSATGASAGSLIMGSTSAFVAN